MSATDFTVLAEIYYSLEDRKITIRKVYFPNEISRLRLFKIIFISVHAGDEVVTFQTENTSIGYRWLYNDQRGNKRRVSLMNASLIH